MAGRGAYFAVERRVVAQHEDDLFTPVRRHNVAHIMNKYADRAKELASEVSFGTEAGVGAVDWASIIAMIFKLFAGCFAMTPKRLEREARDPPRRFLRVLDTLSDEYCPEGCDKEMFKAIILDLGKELTERDAKVGMKEASTT